ncbi:MAG: cell wall metabolism sensor histidine kinase WalK [Desulfobacteraceae bacterium]|nr:cell wall metabolism sensor histidine kinase WalK [Desulfobacteraceae bacterium]
MTLKKKILIGYGVAFAIMTLVVAWSVVHLISLGKATDAILSENYRSILAAENMVDSLERQDSGILLIFLGNFDKGAAQFRENEAVFLKWLARAKDNITIDGEAALITSIETDYAEYRKTFFNLTGKAAQQPVAAVYEESIFPLFNKVRKECIHLRNLNEETMYAASVKAGHVAKRAIWSTVVVAAAALIVAFIFSLFLAERIVQPIRRFMEASRKISSGDYAVQIPVETRDELGRLAREFNEMATQLGRYHEMNIDQIISEKKKGEAIISSIEDGLVVFNTDLQVTAINPAARRMLNLMFIENAMMQCDDILPQSHVCSLIRKIVDTGMQPDVPDEQKILSIEEGDFHRHYLFTVTPVRGRDQGLSGIVMLLRDVTRLKEVERLKSEFVMAASHELRTPLTSLGMSIDLLMEQAASMLPENHQDLLDAAHEEVLRMQALVNDLLDLSKIEAGKIELEFENITIEPLFKHVREVFKSQADIKSVELTTEPNGDMPEFRADANKITWVLSNLVSNALRHVDKNGHIHLAAKRIGPNVHLSVRDDGPGISPAYQSKIFQKFVQVKGRETGGTGLGLAICKEIVRAHGGTIWVESAVGQGSTFTFTLPVFQ